MEFLTIKRKEGLPPKGGTVCCLPKLTCYIPKGKVRKRLKDQGRILNIQLTKHITAATVRACISRAFRDFPSDWVYLDSGQENKIVETDQQSPDGITVCSRRGSLYILDKEVVFQSVVMILGPSRVLWISGALF